MNDRLKFRTPILEDDGKFLAFHYSNALEGVDNYRDVGPWVKGILEQSTGLKDKNGRLIYEGDILEFDLSVPKNGGHHRGIVYWQKQNNLIGWMISSLKHTGSWDIRQIAHPNDWMAWAVVIGNIHENPELLEDK